MQCYDCYEEVQETFLCNKCLSVSDEAVACKNVMCSTNIADLKVLENTYRKLDVNGKIVKV